MIIEPLERALAAGEAVVFVGSGASIPSGLKDWRGFLKDMVAYAKGIKSTESSSGDEDWARTEDLFKNNDYLLVAEMLQKGLPRPTFTQYIVEKFRVADTEPNDIHLSIARLPFALALTTNFDVLLESAYRSAACCTWKDSDAIFHAIRSKQFAIVKLHGSINDPASIRLTRTQYRDGALGNPEFNECIRTLLTWKTFLFVGHSLRDTDLLYLVDQAKVRFGDKFGPHYAIMPKHEVDSKFRSYLKDALSIEAITYDLEKGNPNSATEKVVGILKDLAGRVAKRRYSTYGIGLNDYSINRAQAAQAILNNAAELTGSIRGDVCLIQDDTKPKLDRVAIFPPLKVSGPLPEIDTGSIIETVFLQASTRPEKDYVCLDDVNKDRETLDELGYVHTKYATCDSSVRSEVACPIVADGRRVGTLNLEAKIKAAYTDDHVEVALRVAEELGRIYIQSEQRRRTSASIADFFKDPARFAALLNLSRLATQLDHDYILYEIRYEEKRLLAHHANTTEPFSWKFDDQSLAVKVFNERKHTFIEDAAKALTNEESWLNEEGVKKFKIKGPLWAAPVRVSGQTEAVLVTWLKDPATLNGCEEKDRLRCFRNSSLQLNRLATLLANDIYRPSSPRAEEWLRNLYLSLGAIDGGRAWTREFLYEGSNAEQLLSRLLAAPALPECGLLRIRAWVGEFDKEDIPQYFSIIDAARRNDDQIVRDATYIGKRFSADNDYTRYTLSRYKHDPLAKWQHPFMFGKPDPYAAQLDKAKDGAWIVAPVVRDEDKLLGFVSADCHLRVGDEILDRGTTDPQELALQCRCLDVISHLAQFPMLAILRQRTGGRAKVDSYMAAAPGV